MFRSLLRAGFSFDGQRQIGEKRHLYLQRGEQHDCLDNNNDSIVRLVYKEVYVNMNGSTDLNGTVRQQYSLVRGKEYVVEMMKDRRRDPVRDQGDPNPYQRRNNKGVNGDKGAN